MNHYSIYILMTKRVRFDESDYAVSSKYRKTRPKIEPEKDVKLPIVVSTNIVKD